MVKRIPIAKAYLWLLLGVGFAMFLLMTSPFILLLIDFGFDPYVFGMVCVFAAIFCYYGATAYVKARRQNIQLHEDRIVFEFFRGTSELTAGPGSDLEYENFRLYWCLTCYKGRAWVKVPKWAFPTLIDDIERYYE